MGGRITSAPGYPERAGRGGGGARLSFQQPGRPRQEDLREFKASLGDIARPRLLPEPQNKERKRTLRKPRGKNLVPGPDRGRVFRDAVCLFGVGLGGGPIPTNDAPDWFCLVGDLSGCEPQRAGPETRWRALRLLCFHLRMFALI